MPTVANKLANIIVSIEINYDIDSEIYQADKADINDEIDLEEIDMFMEKFSTMPEIAKLGPLFKSSQPVELTESETEYESENIDWGKYCFFFIKVILYRL